MHKPTVSEEAGMNLFSEAESISLIRLRYFQHQLNEMLKAKQFSQIPIHRAFGQEAAAVGMDITMARMICFASLITNRYHEPLYNITPVDD